MRVTVNVAPVPCLICAAPTSPRRDDVCTEGCASILSEDHFAAGEFDAFTEADMCAAAVHFGADD